MKNYIIVAAIASILLVPALFAETTGTGTTTSTGTTSTGTTGTGTTGTGTTGTGMICSTGSVQTNQAALMAAQVAFSTEIARLIAVKQTAYAKTLTLTGTLRTDAIRAMNTQFRTGFTTAIKTLNSVKKSNKSHAFAIKNCKKDDRREDRRNSNDDNDDNDDDRKNQKKEVKSQIKLLKNQIKEVKRENKNRGGRD